MKVIGELSKSIDTMFGNNKKQTNETNTKQFNALTQIAIVTV